MKKNRKRGLTLNEYLKIKNKQPTLKTNQKGMFIYKKKKNKNKPLLLNLKKKQSILKIKSLRSLQENRFKKQNLNINFVLLRLKRFKKNIKKFKEKKKKFQKNKRTFLTFPSQNSRIGKKKKKASRMSSFFLNKQRKFKFKLYNYKFKLKKKIKFYNFTLV